MHAYSRITKYIQLFGVQKEINLKKAVFPIKMSSDDTKSSRNVVLLRVFKYNLNYDYSQGRESERGWVRTKKDGVAMTV